MIRSRGYNTTRFKSLQTAYYNKPTPLQNASYDLHLIELVRNKDLEKFRAIMGSGISPNPCNSFGESLLHAVCRKGEIEFLKIMLESGASVQVADDYGRTPLSDACWAPRPCFDVVKLLLDRDTRLFHLTDCRGAVPLSYVPVKDWEAWLVFLDSVKDRYWPVQDANRLFEEQQQGNEGDDEHPRVDLTALGANTRPLPGPTNALTPELAAMVVSGKMTPDEAHFLVHDKTECSTSSSWEEDEDENGDGSDNDGSDSDDESGSEDCNSDDESGSDDESDFSLDEEEMADILNTLTLPPSSAQ
jgi:ankyrin repeat protein